MYKYWKDATNESGDYYRRERGEAMTNLPEDVVFALDQIDRVFKENIEESQEPTIAIRNHITRQDTAMRDMALSMPCEHCPIKNDCRDYSINTCPDKLIAHFMGEKGK